MMKKDRLLHIPQVDIWLLLIVLVLMIIGTAVMYSASSYTAETKENNSEYFLQNHLIRIAVGFMLMFIAAIVPYQFWLGLSPIFYGLSLLMLFVLLFRIPPAFEANGSWRWLRIGPVIFQPSDFSRYALILLLARVLKEKQGLLKKFSGGYLKLLLLVAAVALPVALEKDLGTALIIMLIGLLMFYFAEARSSYLLAISSSIATVGFAYMMRTPYQQKRVVDFLNSIVHNVEPVWQVKQSLISLAQGGLIGQGIGNSRQKYEFLPEAHKDFIFSILGEEAGFLGAILVLVLFCLLIRRGIIIARQAPDGYGLLLAGGITVCIGCYALINIAVSLGLLPTTGIPMPFFSYGGSSHVTHIAAIGLLLNISSQGQKAYANYFGWSTYKDRLARFS
ncbi:hypothetical protein A2V82_17465 [candidate division KSB1 bacterium RBG_16_48_16]|nr:MAG: hypothetical protein A2V82_17465 [candidate division KSB1 bacterium RBG_16_48_16]